MGASAIRRLCMRTLLLTLATLLVWSASGLTAPAVPDEADTCPADLVLESRFDDVGTRGAHRDQIDCLVWWGIATGYADGTYGAASAVDRGSMATFLDRLFTVAGMELDEDAPDAFTDDDRSAHEGAINRLHDAGVVDGTAPGTYEPLRSVTRGQIASLLVPTWEALTGTPLEDGPDAFTDDDDNPHEANINRVAAAGLMSGVGDGKVAPLDPVTRAQMASLLVRMLTDLRGVTDIALPYESFRKLPAAAVRVTYHSVDPQPAMFGSDEPVAEPDEAAAEATIAALRAFLDDHLASLAKGGPGALADVIDTGVDRLAWQAGTSGLLYRSSPHGLRYNFEVHHDGAPQWVGVEVIVANAAGTVRWNLLAVPDAEAGFLLLSTSPGGRR